MGETVRRTVVVSAVNIRKGGTLTILRQCLAHLSSLASQYRIVALVHERSLCDYPGIEYIEMPLCIKSWSRRIWAEYVTMHRISLDIAKSDGGREVWLWLSLHDTTPRVEAEHREVYCHNSFPFMKIVAHDFVMDPKIPLFTLLTKYLYKINVHRNDCVIVQQEWFKHGFSSLVGYPEDKIRVIPPESSGYVPVIDNNAEQSSLPLFLYAATPDCHKNFETLCRAAVLLENEVGKGKFKVILTVNGKENRYSQYLYRNWGSCDSIDFHGFMSKDELFRTYASSGCLVFPSRVETWGLPISEYMSVNKSGAMLLADLPYAHEASGGRGEFFSVRDYRELYLRMKRIYEGTPAR